MVYEPGGRLPAGGQILRLFTDTGPVGECLAGRGSELSTIPQFWHYLKGKSALHRERIYDDVKRALRQSARIGVAPIDNALWDLAGKLFEVPIHRLLGGHKESVPCYASTYHGDEAGGLDSPEAYADFAVQCREMGYPAFKIHGWSKAPVAREVANVLAVREAVGDDVDLMPRSRLRAAHLRRRRQGGTCLRRGAVLLVRGPVPRRRHLAVRPPQAAPVDQDAAAADRARALAGAARRLRDRRRHRLRARRHRLRRHHRGDEAGPRRRGARHRHRVPRPEPGRAPVHGRDPQHQLLRDGTARLPKAPPSHATELYLDHRDALDAIDERGHVPVGQAPGLGARINWDWVAAHRTGIETYD